MLHTTVQTCGIVPKRSRSRELLLQTLGGLGLALGVLLLAASLLVHTVHAAVGFTRAHAATAGTLVVALGFGLLACGTCVAHSITLLAAGSTGGGRSGACAAGNWGTVQRAAVTHRAAVGVAVIKRATVGLVRAERRVTGGSDGRKKSVGTVHVARRKQSVILFFIVIRRQRWGRRVLQTVDAFAALHRQQVEVDIEAAAVAGRQCGGKVRLRWMVAGIGSWCWDGHSGVHHSRTILM